MAHLRDPVLRSVYRVGYRVLRVWWRLRRPSNEGVKCLLTRGGEILLVRHTYGDRDRWELPGGGVKRGERPSDAATREVREELGLEVPGWTFLGDLFERIDHKHDRLWCFTSDVGDRAIDRDAAEIAETGWFTRDELPPTAARYVARIARLAG